MDELENVNHTHFKGSDKATPLSETRFTVAPNPAPDPATATPRCMAWVLPLPGKDAKLFQKKQELSRHCCQLRFNHVTSAETYKPLDFNLFHPPSHENGADDSCLPSLSKWFLTVHFWFISFLFQLLFNI